MAHFWLLECKKASKHLGRRQSRQCKQFFLLGYLSDYRPWTVDLQCSVATSKTESKKLRVEMGFLPRRYQARLEMALQLLLDLGHEKAHLSAGMLLS